MKSGKGRSNVKKSPPPQNLTPSDLRRDELPPLSAADQPSPNQPWSPYPAGNTTSSSSGVLLSGNSHGPTATPVVDEDGLPQGQAMLGSSTGSGTGLGLTRSGAPTKLLSPSALSGDDIASGGDGGAAALLMGLADWTHHHQGGAGAGNGGMPPQTQQPQQHPLMMVDGPLHDNWHDVAHSAEMSQQIAAAAMMAAQTAWLTNPYYAAAAAGMMGAFGPGGGPGRQGSAAPAGINPNAFAAAMAAAAAAGSNAAFNAFSAGFGGMNPQAAAAAMAGLGAASGMMAPHQAAAAAAMQQQYAQAMMVLEDAARQQQQQLGAMSFFGGGPGLNNNNNNATTNFSGVNYGSRGGRGGRGGGSPQNGGMMVPPSPAVMMFNPYSPMHPVINTKRSRTPPPSLQSQQTTGMAVDRSGLMAGAAMAGVGMMGEPNGMNMMGEPNGMNMMGGNALGLMSSGGGEFYSTPAGNSAANFSPCMAEFHRDNGAAKWCLEHIMGHIEEFSRDQDGSRFIQRKLDQGVSPSTLDAIVDEVLPCLSSMIGDVFGNYVIQKLLDYMTPVHLRHLADCLAGHVVEQTLQPYGCRVMQKCLDINLEGENAARDIVFAELQGNVGKCIQDQNGNHVIQRCVEVAPGRSDFIVQSFYGHVRELATHAYGCRVLQCALQHAQKHEQPLLEELLASLESIVTDQFGNYVVQHALQHCSSPPVRNIIAFLVRNAYSLSTHKFASNVIERLCAKLNEEERSTMLGHLMTPSNDTAELMEAKATGNDNGSKPISFLYTLTRDQFGNYVVQRLFEVATPEEKMRIAQHIVAFAASLKHYTFGKHIVGRFERFISNGGVEDRPPRGNSERGATGYNGGNSYNNCGRGGGSWGQNNRGGGRGGYGGRGGGTGGWSGRGWTYNNNSNNNNNQHPQQQSFFSMMGS